MNTYILLQSTRKDKKYMIITPQGKIIHFGAAGFSDYNLHKDKRRRDLYILRHQKREDWTTPNPGFFSRWLLWGNYTNINDNINYIKNKYGLNIINNI